MPDISHALTRSSDTADVGGDGVAVISTIEADGATFIQMHDGRLEQALMLDSVSADLTPGDQVLVFSEGVSRPVIVGKVVQNAQRTTGLSGKKVQVDGQTIRIEADQELALTCGRATLLLKKDGKIVLRGTQIVSRSSGANKLKGATVKIN